MAFDITNINLHHKPRIRTYGVSSSMLTIIPTLRNEREAGHPVQKKAFFAVQNMQYFWSLRRTKYIALTARGFPVFPDEACGKNIHILSKTCLSLSTGRHVLGLLFRPRLRVKI
jgi:hypothetical protein